MTLNLRRGEPADMKYLKCRFSELDEQGFAARIRDIRILDRGPPLLGAERTGLMCERNGGCGPLENLLGILLRVV